MAKNLTVIPTESRCKDTSAPGKSKPTYEEVSLQLQYELQQAIQRVIHGMARIAIDAGLTLADIAFHAGSSIASICFNEVAQQLIKDEIEIDDEHREILRTILKEDMVAGYSEKTELLLSEKRECDKLIVFGKKISLQ